MNLSEETSLPEHIANVPAEWGVRAIFSNAYSEDIWLARISQNNAPETRSDLLIGYMTLLRKAESFGCFVSFGPGGGETDRVLLEPSCTHERISYIPIDISIKFLRAAYLMLKDSCNIPVCIRADFETSNIFIESELKPYLTKRNFFSILGNTIGCADLGEENLMHMVCFLMKDKDYLLLSFATGKFTQANFEATSNLAEWKNLRHLIAGGVAAKTGTPLSEVLDHFNDYVILQFGTSDIPGVQSLEAWETVKESPIN